MPSALFHLMFLVFPIIALYHELRWAERLVRMGEMFTKLF
jgi:hypothetical protein